MSGTRQIKRIAIERALKFVNSDTFDDQKVAILEERMHMLQLNHDQHMELHSKDVESAENEEDKSALEEEVMALENTFFDVRMTFRTKIGQLKQCDAKKEISAASESEGHTPVASPPLNITPATVTKPEPKPEPIQLFDGSISKWAEWKEKFMAQFGNNTNVKAGEKLVAFQGLLVGTAERIENKYYMQGADFDSLFGAMDKIYSNEYLLIPAVLSDLLSYSSGGSNPKLSATYLLETWNQVVHTLEEVSCPLAQWDTLLAYIIILKMPPRLKENWDNQFTADRLPTVERVVHFLTEQSSMPGVERAMTSAACYNCHKAHQMFKCHAFLNMTLSERKERVMQLKLCANCLSPGHKTLSLSCKFGPCRRCNKGQFHNSLLCGIPTASERSFQPTPFEQAFRPTAAKPPQKEEGDWSN